MNVYYYRFNALDEKAQERALDIASTLELARKSWFDEDGGMLCSRTPECCEAPDILRYKFLKEEYAGKRITNHYEVLRQDWTVAIVTEDIDRGYGKNREHLHLCRDCGQPLYKANWCKEKEDHRISGRCDACWKQIGTVWMLEYANAYGTSLSQGYHPQGTSRYQTDYIPYHVVATGEHTALANIKRDDFPDRSSDGSFLGCDNQTWILTEEEKEHFLQLNSDRQKAIDDKKEKERAEREAEAAKRDARKKTYTILQEHELTQPRGGEGDIDGYWDVDIQSIASGVVTRVVMRNVFDYGYYGYPKRTEGSKEALERAQWGEDEKAAVDWAREFSPLPNHIRM